jgi:hypothetical protein
MTDERLGTTRFMFETFFEVSVLEANHNVPGFCRLNDLYLQRHAVRPT